MHMCVCVYVRLGIHILRAYVCTYICMHTKRLSLTYSKHVNTRMHIEIKTERETLERHRETEKYRGRGREGCKEGERERKIF